MFLGMVHRSTMVNYGNTVWSTMDDHD